MWTVYAAEIGYGYAGDEYWQTFDERTPGWTSNGTRGWIRDAFVAPTLFLSMEDERRVEVHPREIKQSYLEEFGRFLVETKQACTAADVDYELVRTDEPLDKVLLRFLARRMGGR